MGKQDHHSNRSHDLPQVLVLNNQMLSSMLESYYSDMFRFINLPSSVPLHQFLTAHNHDPSSLRALIWGMGGHLITDDFLRLLPALGLVVTPSAGTDHIDLSACRRREVQVANAGSLFSEDVADLAVGLFIDVIRKITAVDRYVRTRLRPSASQFPLGSKGTFGWPFHWERKTPFTATVQFQSFGWHLEAESVIPFWNSFPELTIRPLPSIYHWKTLPPAWKTVEMSSLPSTIIAH